MLRYLSVKTGLSLNYISKDEKVSYLLSQVWEIFGENVILKGGIALNRVYLSKLNVSRFSEDIDLDYFGKGDLNERIKAVETKVKRIEDFNIRGPRVLHRTLRFDCHYTNELGNQDRVRLELYLSQPPYIKSDLSLVKSPFVDTYPTLFKIYSFEDLLVRKLIALYNRMEGKDIYDVFYALKFDLKEKKFEEALNLILNFYKISGSNLFKELIKKLDEAKKNAKYIGNSANHFIPKNLRPNWIEIIESLKAEIENLQQSSRK